MAAVIDARCCRVPCVPPSRLINVTFLTEHTLSFLPTFEQARFAAAVARKDGDPVKDAINLLATTLQVVMGNVSDEDCYNANLTTRLVLREGGFGSTLSGLLKSLLWAMVRRRIPLGAQPTPREGSRLSQQRPRIVKPQGLDLYVDPKRCSLQNLECFLLPLSSCPRAARASLPASALGGRWLELAAYEDALQRAPEPSQQLVHAVRTAGRLPTVALLTRWVLHPSHAVKRSIIAAKADVGWPGEMGLSGHSARHTCDVSSCADAGTTIARAPLMIGLHVRLGDSCTRDALSRHNRTCDNLSHFLPAVREAQQAYAPHWAPVYVYLATDDEGVVEDARRINGTDGVRWLIRGGDARRKWPSDRRGNIPQIEELLKQRRLNGYTEAEQVLIDIFLLSECDVLIGKFSSNIPRLAYALMAMHSAITISQSNDEEGALKDMHRKDPRGRRSFFAQPSPSLCFPPFISLDHPWCYAFGEALPLRPLRTETEASEPSLRLFPNANRVPFSNMDRASDARLVGGFEC